MVKANLPPPSSSSCPSPSLEACVLFNGGKRIVKRVNNGVIPLGGGGAGGRREEGEPRLSTPPE